MKSIKQRIKKFFCKHEYEMILSAKSSETFRCKKCGKTYVIKAKWFDKFIACKL